MAKRLARVMIAMNSDLEFFRESMFDFHPDFISLGMERANGEITGSSFDRSV